MLGAERLGYLGQVAAVALDPDSPTGVIGVIGSKLGTTPVPWK